MADFGFVRITAASHPIHVADPVSNLRESLAALERHHSSDIVVFGELSLTGYTCGDLFSQDVLVQGAVAALETLAATTQDSQQIVVVGLPLRVTDRLYNVAAVLSAGRVLGLIPKQFLPNYQEFYEARWFAAADGREPKTVEVGGMGEVPFGIDLLFQRNNLLLGVELCEDLWMPIPPSSHQAMAGANVLLNLSASNELIGKAAWRETLIRSQSGRCLAAYAYASAGPTESSTDLVFSGQCMIAESGVVLSESARIGKEGCAWIEHAHATADVDLQRLQHDRQVTVSWQHAAQRNTAAAGGSSFRRIQLPEYASACDGSLRSLSPTPFVPQQHAQIDERCSEIFGIQCAALAKRISRLPATATLNIGVSGGLDSTLALLVAVKTCQQQAWPIARICGITMPGFGTTEQTLSSARELMQLLGITYDEIDIRPLCLDTFIGLNHAPFGIDLSQKSLDQFTEQLIQLPADQRHDLVFENVQARIRTMLLMNRGFVLGTGDLSEQALGWSTYNGDHMSMYNVNTSIPKTLVRFLIDYLAAKEFSQEVQDCLRAVTATPISPELLPTTQDGEIHQKTEDTLGAYELHDFFLYHMLRFGCSPRKILHLASLTTFSKPYSVTEIRQTLRTFLTRFFNNQFKRSCVPDGPKVGSVSLSPRGDWRMPSDAEANAWLAELEVET